MPSCRASIMLLNTGERHSSIATMQNLCFRGAVPGGGGNQSVGLGTAMKIASRLRKNAVSSALSGLGDPALACRPHGDRIVRRGGRARIEASSYRLAREIAHPDQVVHGQPKGKHPAHPRHPAMAGLAQQANLFEPAEDLLDRKS